MSVAEALTLLGIVVVFLTTVAGWIFTHRAQARTQREIVVLQDELSSSRDLAQRLTDDRLAAIRQLETWVQSGRDIYLDAQSFAEPRPTPATPAQVTAFRERIFPPLRRLRADAPRFYYLAKLWEPQNADAPQWRWGSQPLPTRLPQLLDAYEDEVLDQTFDALLGPASRAHPLVPDQFHSLHEATISAIERIKTQPSAPPGS